MNYQIQMHFLKNVHFVKALLFVIMIKMRKRKSMINSNKKEHFLFSDFICIQCSNKYTDNVLDGAMTHNSLELEKIVCSNKKFNYSISQAKSRFCKPWWFLNFLLHKKKCLVVIFIFIIQLKPIFTL